MNLRDIFERGTIQQKGAVLARCGDDLASFMEYVHGWVPRPHQVEWIRMLSALVKGSTCECGDCLECRVGNEKRLLIVAFPGAGKSDTLIEFCEWLIGRDVDTANFGFFSYNDNVATERSMAVRDVVWSPKDGGNEVA